MLYGLSGTRYKADGTVPALARLPERLWSNHPEGPGVVARSRRP